ncbi:MAG: hypothetical protein EOP20_10175 [Hyphomicrobiales bacterium]|nr:MAG: hypothetical protein EOP20_10175 [Hyphomicrobiales bacterium]
MTVVGEEGASPKLVIASAAKQCRLPQRKDSGLLRFARNDGGWNPYLIGGAYCTPPAFHSWFMPRGIFSFDFSPILRSYISP